MTKGSGLGDNLYVAGYNLSGDINSLKAIGGGPKPWPVTGIDKFAYERIGLLRDGRFSYVSYFNDAPGQSHPVHAALPTADVNLTYCRGTSIGSAAASLVAKQIGYDGKRDGDGGYLFDVDALPNGYGVDWGNLLTAGKRTDTGATNGTSYDFTTVSTLFGWQAFLHVFAFAGTDATIKIQDSADNVAFADLAGGAFTAIGSAPFTQRLEGGRTATVRRYLRVATTTSAGFTNLQFAVSFTRNDVAVSF